MQVLKGKTAIITGAGKGLGKAMSLALAAEGVHLGLIGRTAADLELLQEEIGKGYSDVKVYTAQADVANYTAVQAAVASLMTSLPGVDILINNAGILRVGGFLDLPEAEWEEVFRINVFGSYYMVRAVLPYMITQGSGDIINISSTAGLKGSANLSAYGASKAAVSNMSEALMQEVRKKNIRVSTVFPSTISTSMTLQAGFTDGNAEKVLQPEDLANLVVHNLKLPQRAMVKDISLWSTNP